MADRSVKVVLGANVTGLVQGMQTAKRATQDYATSAMGYYKQNQAQLDQIGTAALGAGAALTAAAGFAVKSAMDWEVAWTGVLKTVDGTPAQLAKVEDGLRGLAKETGFAHTEVAAVGEAAGQLGISTEGVVRFTDTMLAMGVSTNLSAEEAATGLARFRNIMGSSELEVSNMGSTIVALGNNFATTEREILEMSLRLSGAGKQAGLTEADVMGVATAMSSVGIEAEAGGTAMSLTMKRIGKEVESGGGKLGLFAQTAGMSAEEFKTAWESDASGALTAFVAGLGETEAMGKSTNAVLTELGITGIREADALLRLSANAEGLADALGVAKDGWAENIALMDEADKFYNTTSQKGKQAWADIKDAAIDAGDALLPVVANLFDAVGNVAGAFGSLPGPVKGGLAAIAGTAGVALLAVGGLLKLAGAIQSTMDAYNVLATKGGKGSGFIGALGRNATRAAIPLALAVGTYTAAGKAAERSSDDINNLAKELENLGKTGKTGTDLTDVFGKDLEGESRRFARDVRGIGEAIEEFKKYGDDNTLTQAGRKISGIFGSGFVGSLTGSEGVYKSVKAIKDMDAAYVQLARNKPDAAIKSFEKLRDVAIEQGTSIEDLQRAFPGMTEILQSASEQMGGTGDAAEILNGELTELAPSAQESAEEMAAMRDAAQEIGESFFDMGEVLQGSLTGFGDALMEQTEALANFRQNAAEALRKGADETLVDYLIAQGPEGAAMLEQLADATESEVGRISDSWGKSREEVARFVEFQTGVPKEVVTEFKTPGADGAVDKAVEVAQKYNMTPDEVATVMEALDYASGDIEAVLRKLRGADGQSATVNVKARDAATQVIRGVQAALGGLGDKTVTVTTRRKTIGGDFADGGINGIGNVRAYAGGGVDENGRTVPRVPQLRNGNQGTVMWGEPETGWEAYISGKPSMQARNRLILTDAATRLGLQVVDPSNVMAFADGGRLDRLNAQRRVRDLQRDLREKERYGRKPKKGPDRRPKRYVLRGLDREIAREELKEARAELRDLRKPASQRREARQERAEERARAREQRRDDIASGREAFLGNADLSEGALRSPAAVERALQRSITDMATFTQLLIALKGKGASPWLLGQLQGFGPTKGAIRLARQYLADNAKLRSTNALAAQASEVARVYGTVTTDKRWESSKAWSQPIHASTQKSLDRTANINVSLDGDYLSREVAKLVKHELAVGMGGAVLPS